MIDPDDHGTHDAMLDAQFEKRKAAVVCTECGRRGGEHHPRCNERDDYCRVCGEFDQCRTTCSEFGGPEESDGSD